MSEDVLGTIPDGGEKDTGLLSPTRASMKCSQGSHFVTWSYKASILLVISNTCVMYVLFYECASSFSIWRAPLKWMLRDGHVPDDKNISFYIYDTQYDLAPYVLC